MISGFRVTHAVNVEARRIPHGFYEPQMRAYFSQFGNISRLRLSRNRTTGASKHYAFLEFESAAVAAVVAATMDNYLLFGHILKCKLVPREQVHEKLWIGANKRFKKVPWSKIEGRKLEQPMGREHWEKKVEREKSKRSEKARKLKDIMGYELDAPIKEVADLPVRAVEAITEGTADADEESTLVTGSREKGAVVVSEQVTTKKARKGKKAKGPEGKTSETNMGSGIMDTINAGIEKADAMLETVMDATNEVLVPTARKGKRKADETLETVQNAVSDVTEVVAGKETKKPKKSKDTKNGKPSTTDEHSAVGISKDKMVEGSKIADEMLESRQGRTKNDPVPIDKKRKRKERKTLDAVPASIEDEPIGQAKNTPEEPTTKKPKTDKKKANGLVAEPTKKTSKAAEEKSEVDEKEKAQAPAENKLADQKGKSSSNKAARRSEPADDSASKDAVSAKRSSKEPAKKSKTLKPGLSNTDVTSEEAELAPQGHKGDPPGPALKPTQSTPAAAATAPKRSHKGKDTVEQTFENAAEHGAEEAKREMKLDNDKKGKPKAKKSETKSSVESSAVPTKEADEKTDGAAGKAGKSKAKKDTKRSSKEEEQPSIAEPGETSTPATKDTAGTEAPKSSSKRKGSKTAKNTNKPTAADTTESSTLPIADLESHKADPPGPALNPQQTTPASALTAPKRTHNGQDTVEETFENAEQQGVKAAEKELQEEEGGNGDGGAAADGKKKGKAKAKKGKDVGKAGAAAATTKS